MSALKAPYILPAKRITAAIVTIIILLCLRPEVRVITTILSTKIFFIIIYHLCVYMQVFYLIFNVFFLFFYDLRVQLFFLFFFHGGNTVLFGC